MISFEWDYFTLVLYISIIIFTFILGSYSVRINKGFEILTSSRYKINNLAFYSSFFILFIFSSIRSIGNDYPVYQEIFTSSNNDSDILVFGIEPGFVLLNKIIYYLTKNFLIFIPILSFITLFFVFKSFEYFRSKINIGFSLLGYTTLYYFQSYSLIRVYLVSAILLYAFRFLYEKKYLTYLFYFILCLTIHFSTILLVVPILGLLIYKIKPIFFYIYLLVIFFVSYTFSSILFLLNVSDRYTSYIDNIDKTSSFGFAQILFYLPIFFCIRVAKKYKMDVWILEIFVVFTWSAFLFGLLGYWIPTISRVNYIITYPFLLFVPMFINLMKGKKNYILINLLFIIYFVVRLVIYFSALAFADGINKYEFIQI